MDSYATTMNRLMFLECPVSLEQMKDPIVLFPLGHSYDRKSICQSLLHYPNLDPKSGVYFDRPLYYTTNFALRSALQDMDAFVPYDDAYFQDAYERAWKEKVNAAWREEFIRDAALPLARNERAARNDQRQLVHIIINLNQNHGAEEIFHLMGDVDEHISLDESTYEDTLSSQEEEAAEPMMETMEDDGDNEPLSGEGHSLEEEIVQDELVAIQDDQNAEVIIEENQEQAQDARRHETAVTRPLPTEGGGQGCLVDEFAKDYVAEHNDTFNLAPQKSNVLRFNMIHWVRRPTWLGSTNIFHSISGRLIVIAVVLMCCFAVTSGSVKEAVSSGNQIERCTCQARTAKTTGQFVVSGFRGILGGWHCNHCVTKRNDLLLFHRIGSASSKKPRFYVRRKECNVQCNPITGGYGTSAFDFTQVAGEEGHRIQQKKAHNVAVVNTAGEQDEPHETKYWNNCDTWYMLSLPVAWYSCG